ncbi:unnamed protein product [Diabrotica balteata]|uniref:Purple acid phosphatase C-terminal domain-containing protein n=1 Tax=Diabrotica balteata TaxID=107213 RepID=A0A9N9SUA5_DIABA|nr:unnamed protein product [Diabrotica balteata]
MGATNNLTSIRGNIFNHNSIQTTMAPVQFTTGSAGCDEGRDSFVKELPEWSAFRSSDYGYSRLKVYNSSHMHLEQVSDDKSGDVIDSFWIVKDKHGLYPHSKMDWAKVDSMRLKSMNRNSIYNSK